MSGIFNGIQAILDAVVGPLKWIADTIKLAIQVMGFVYKALVQITSIILTIPAWLQGVALATIAIAVAYQLFGREQGK